MMKYNIKLIGWHVLLFLLRVLAIVLLATCAAFVIWQISMCYDLPFSMDHAILAGLGIAVLLSSLERR